ncbi:protein N-terminal asparagine amidohydrolase-like isoform X2 [Watersipora subatra]|uniref:protein N-terminal asparagine amidohydrolase-like isoform X2 n=1 Tax=Watersipora subatra TaxID=2589382 RepID=UPI00355B9AED
MPLLWENSRSELDKVASLLRSSSDYDIPLPDSLKKLGLDWSQKLLKEVNGNVLYVSQREYGIIDPLSKGEIEYIATDSATTCHILILIHPESRVVGVAHFDGCNTMQGVQELLTSLDTRVAAIDSSSAPSSSLRYKLYLFGGFSDPKGTSKSLSLDLLDALSECSQLLELTALCIGEQNSRYQDDICYPIFYGAGVDCNTLEVHKIECSDRGPLQDVKSCRNFVGPKEMVSCWDHTTREMFIEPFDYQPLKKIDLWLKQSDETLLKYFSTSPEQEPPHFVASLRASLLCLLKHPQPLTSLFKDGIAFRFKLVDGHWIEVKRDTSAKT